jgi:phage repressor protein C with HTH and peptisase S24 domain
MQAIHYPEVVYPPVSNGLNACMSEQKTRKDELYELRRKNLRALANVLGAGKRGGIAKLAERLEVAPAQLSHYIGGVGSMGVKNLGEGNARAYEQKLGLAEGWLDREQPEPWAVAALEAMSEHRKFVIESPDMPPYMTPSGSITIDVLDVRASMGGGLPAPEQETVIDSIKVPQNWVRENLPHITSPSNLKIITGYGDSMLGTFSHGDPLIVDTGVNEMRIDAVYVFAMHKELFIKRIQRLPNGAIKIISDNREKYDPITVTADERSAIQVLGRVVCAWNLRKL